NGQPSRDVCSVIFADLRCEFQVCTEEGCSEFGDEFFASVAFIAPVLAAKVALDARRVLRPVSRLVRKRCIEARCIHEALDRWHLDIVMLLRVVGPTTAESDMGVRGSEECFCSLDSLDGREFRLRLCVVLRGQAFYLLDIEYGIALQKRNLALDLRSLAVL